MPLLLVPWWVLMVVGVGLLLKPKSKPS